MYRKRKEIISGSDFDYLSEKSFNSNLITLNSDDSLISQNWVSVNTGSATVENVTLGNLKLFREPTAKFTKLNDNATNGFCSITKSLSVIEWEKIRVYGTEINFKFILDSSNGQNGFKFILGCNSEDNLLDFKDRVYSIEFENSNGVLKINTDSGSYILDGQNKNPFIKSLGEIIDITISISPGFTVENIFVNGRNTPVEMTFIESNTDSIVSFTTDENSTASKICFIKNLFVKTKSSEIIALITPVLFQTTLDLVWEVSDPVGITDYIIEYKQTSSGTWLTYVDGVSISKIIRVEGLSLGVSYGFRLKAVRGSIETTYSNIATVTLPITSFSDAFDKGFR